MKPRHLVMMSLGSAIGAGLFVGSGAGVQAAGPAVLISYVVAGLIVIFVMRALGELVAADPNPGAFSHYAGKAMGPAAAFAVGALWWVQLCLVVAAEATAAAQIAASYIPAVPQWVIALAIMLIFTAINLTTSGSFGEFEFWFSLIKVAFVVLFVALGAAYLFGWTPAEPPAQIFSDGFMPTGISGIAAGLLVVAFAFGGIEIVAVAAAETANPQRSVSQAIKTIVWRILFLYIGSVAIIVLVLPWTDDRLAESPFVAVLETAGLPFIASLLAAVIVIALLSSMNANIYGASRMSFSMSQRSMLPRGLGRTNRRGVPVPAVLATSAFGFVAVALNYFWAAEVLGVLLNRRLDAHRHLGRDVGLADRPASSRRGGRAVPAAAHVGLPLAVVGHLGRNRRDHRARPDRRIRALPNRRYAHLRHRALPHRHRRHEAPPQRKGLSQPFVSGAKT